jgi:ring-1,2-phenylacetyl-CoA epoxidase subunit PaaE
MSKFHSLAVTALERPTRDAIVVTLGVPPELATQFQYQAGQHLTVRTYVEGTELRRSYSICSAVQDHTLRIAVKRVADGVFSNWANDSLQPGAALDVLPPSGHFGLGPHAPGPRNYVAFAAGSGITPVLSIVKTALIAEPDCHFTLFYGNRASSSVLFRDELAELKDTYLTRLNLVHVLSREQQEIDLFNGRIDRDKAAALLDQWMGPAAIDAAFVCGPYAMMQAVTEALLAHGIDAAQIRQELFATSAGDARPKAVSHRVEGRNECEVVVVLDGRRHLFQMAKNSENVLDAALAQGIELPYSCKAGVCSTCRCKKNEGEVDMDVNFALEDYEVARGFILTCQSYPVSDRLVLDFDAET